MNDRPPACTACFETGTRTRCQVFENSRNAIAEFAGIHQRGEAAYMCQQNDHRYRVCVEISALRVHGLPGPAVAHA